MGANRNTAGDRDSIPARTFALDPDAAARIQRLLPLQAELVRECALMRTAMVARCRVCLYVTDHDRANEVIAVDALVCTLRALIREITGGQTMYHAVGDYVPPVGVAMDEDTRVLEIFLPKVLTDSIRDRLTNLFIWFGYSTNQEVVQVSVRDLAYWLPTGLLIDAKRAAAGPSKEAKLMAG